MKPSKWTKTRYENHSLFEYGFKHPIKGANEKTLDQRNKKMTNLKQEAENYVPNITKNISECPKVPVDVKVHTREGEAADGSKFSFKYIVVDEQEYRLPASVTEQLQQLLKSNPNLTHVQVNKTGEGLKTKYFVAAAV